MEQGNEEGCVWKGLVAGLAAGLFASWAMNQFQARLARVTEGVKNPAESVALQSEEQDNATVKTARAISKGIFGHELTEKEKEPAGAAVHYAFGTATGGLYGAMAEMAPEITTGAGLPFGAAFWLTADEVAVPLLGLSKGPRAYPVSTHAYALASHLVYGLTTEISRRAVRQVLR